VLVLVGNLSSLFLWAVPGLNAVLDLKLSVSSWLEFEVREVKVDGVVRVGVLLRFAEVLRRLGLFLRVVGVEGSS